MKKDSKLLSIKKIINIFIKGYKLLIKIKFFALYKEKAKTKDTVVEIPNNSTIQDLCDLLIENYPNLSKFKNNIIFAVNYEYQDNTYILSDNDEIALIPPVSGG
ncbi:MAG: molybdopterin converting factor subunit 1 [Chloroflexi bacterium]|nr:molybdopterin converting factor subunit 1 [Chloroflexota bacterium]